MSKSKRSNIFSVALLVAVGLYAVNDRYAPYTRFMVSSNQLEVIDLENKIYSVNVTKFKDEKTVIDVDFQFNGEGVAPRLYIKAEVYPKDVFLGSFVTSKKIEQTGRQSKRLVINRFSFAQEDYALNNITVTIYTRGIKNALATLETTKNVLMKYNGDFNRFGIANSTLKEAADLLDVDSSRGQRERAKKILDKIIYEEPNNSEAYIELARYHMKSNWGEVGLKSAEQMLNEALQIDPIYANTHVLLGYVYTHQKRYKEAVKEYELAEKLGTDNLWLYTNWGQLYTKTDEKEKAYLMLDKAIKLGRTFTRNDRALMNAYHIYLRYSEKKHDVKKIGLVHSARAKAFNGNGCYIADYADYLITEERELIKSKSLAKNAEKLGCGDARVVNKVLAKVLLIRSLYHTYDEQDSSDNDYRRSRGLYSDQARLIADLSNKNKIGDLYQRLMQQRNITVDVKGPNGLTALAYCVSERHYTCVENLLSNGANPNQVGNERNWSILMLAVLSKDKLMVKRLLVAGADSDFTTKDGVTAHALATYSGDKTIISLLNNASQI